MLCKFHNLLLFFRAQAVPVCLQLSLKLLILLRGQALPRANQHQRTMGIIQQTGFNETFKIALIRLFF